MEKTAMIFLLFILPFFGAAQKIVPVIGILTRNHSIDSIIDSQPCETDTIKGYLYRAVEYGSSSIEIGYYIAKCGGFKIGNFYGAEDAPTWIPGRYLRRDEVDKNGRLIYKEFQWQYNTGYFTDEHFKKVKQSSIYGLMVIPRKGF